MHYANGRAAKVGDLVRGKGYNAKYEIIGILVAAQPANSACNCQVAHIGPSSAAVSEGWCSDGSVEFPNAGGATTPSYFKSSLEYGQLDAFVALDPKTGEVLPPEQPSEADTWARTCGQPG